MKTDKLKSTTQAVIDIIYTRGCIKREDLIKELLTEAEDLKKEDLKKLEDRVTKALTRLVKKGVIKRASYAIYCKP
jgi:predicted transcriptional regulator